MGMRGLVRRAALAGATLAALAGAARGMECHFCEPRCNQGVGVFCKCEKGAEAPRCTEPHIWSAAAEACVLPAECSAKAERGSCPPRFVWDTCAACQDTCEYPDLSTRCDCHPTDSAGCKCVGRNRVLDERTNRCIKRHNCMASANRRCGPRAYWDQCPECQDTCDQPEVSKVCRPKCEGGCKCKRGYLLDTIINRCVPPQECPSPLRL
mmetsp:Transcript_17352/g.49601  ORF Transcript_17352/g.49601 Transcript_17352/m.49601 type:complete len:209 (+) Transcript_17352:153-779(+)